MLAVEQVRLRQTQDCSLRASAWGVAVHESFDTR